MKRLLILGLVAVFAACAPKPATTSSTNSATNSNTAASNTNSAPPAENNVTPTSSTPAEKKPAVPLSMLPVELKGDAYEYYGLSNEKPVDMEIDVSPGNRILTGSVETNLESVENGKAIFHREATGQLASIYGVQELSLEPGGIFVKSMTIGKTGGHDIEMPANLAPGATWTSTEDLSTGDQSVKVTSTYKVVGVQKLVTKKGTFDALVITSSGKGILGGRNARMNSKGWYVKGLGNAKLEVEIIYPDGKKSTITSKIV